MPSGAVSRGGSPSRGSAVVVGVPTGVLHALVDQVHARLADPDAGVVVGAADIGEVERIARRVEALRLALVARADRQQVHRRTGHSSTSAWVASATRSGGADAARKVQLATALDGEGLAATRAAFDAGDVSSRSVGIIAATMDKLPETLTDVERAKVETSLVQKAQQLNPGRLSRAPTPNGLPLRWLSMSKPSWSIRSVGPTGWRRSPCKTSGMGPRDCRRCCRRSLRGCWARCCSR